MSSVSNTTILVTGGAGYIGSHTCVELVQAGYRVVVVDDLQNSSRQAVVRAGELAGEALPFERVDLRDAEALDDVFRRYSVQAVIHFAGLKAVGESVSQPLRYYENNLVGTLRLLECMSRHEVRQLVFSSSATVYGEPEQMPIREDAPLGALNPYGRTKLMIEDILRDTCQADPKLRVALLRYFNPVGAHPSGRIGEDPAGIPNNLMPFVMQVAVGRRPLLGVFGNDYPTPDGTCVRDYIHVVDLALGHLRALSVMDSLDGCVPINLGTGQGHSVLEVVAAASHAAGKPIPHEIQPRRPGDAAIVYADPTRAAKLLGWKAERSLESMCTDHFRWQRDNPQGYGERAGS